MSFVARKMRGGLEPIHIVDDNGSEGYDPLVDIIATVHRRQGYEALAKQFAAAPDLLAALRETWRAAHETGSGREHGPEAGYASCNAPVCRRARETVEKAGGKP